MNRRDGSMAVPKSMILAWALLLLVPALAFAAGGPLRDAKSAVSVHAPYSAGVCGLCHVADNPAAPGALRGPVNALCFDCHSDVREALADAVSTHKAATTNCAGCHNAHDSMQPKLLSATAPGLCLSCHAPIGKLEAASKVRHGALQNGRTCLNCHSPHAAKVEKLLNALPYDLCVSCHSGASPLDGDGKPLTNFGQLLAQNRYAHGPVAAKDCSACHVPHAGDHFRLLVADYPAVFYAPFDPANYELCFNCHNEAVIQAAETDSLTGFRDGKRNLHFVHVNKSDRGRTCRACHEVHAAPQPHLIRESVPYGTGGWLLRVNYQPTANGGTCEKTCHGAKTYDRKLGLAPAGSKP